MDTSNNPDYITEHWKNEVKEVLDDALMLRQEISWWDGDFPNGDILNVPTMGQLTARNYTEGNKIKLEDTTSTNYTLQITKYKQAGIQITDKFKEDSAYISTLVGKYQVEIIQAIMRQLESDIANLQAQQTAADPNLIDGMDHRFVSIATDNVGGAEDFQLALLALSESRSMTGNASAYINPLFLFRLQQISNVISQDVYGQNVLLKEGGLMGKMITAAQETRSNVGMISGFNTFNHTVLDNSLSETITATSGTPYVTGTVSSARANMFLGRDAFVGAMRTKPSVHQFRDDTILSDILHATFRYGIDLYRPESLVVCLTDAA
jgi:hypothetical protein